MKLKDLVRMALSRFHEVTCRFAVEEEFRPFGELKLPGSKTTKLGERLNKVKSNFFVFGSSRSSEAGAHQNAVPELVADGQEDQGLGNQPSNQSGSDMEENRIHFILEAIKKNQSTLKILKNLIYFIITALVFIGLRIFGIF